MGDRLLGKGQPDPVLVLGVGKAGLRPDNLSCFCACRPEANNRNSLSKTVTISTTNKVYLTLEKYKQEIPLDLSLDLECRLEVGKVTECVGV